MEGKSEGAFGEDGMYKSSCMSSLYMCCISYDPV